METAVKKLYEAMFLVDSAQAAADWDEVCATIKNILKRSEAEIVSLNKWDERKLAYEIKGVIRGTYILCYFKADGSRIQDIERDVRLSERIMRALILTAEHITEQEVDNDTPAVLAENQMQQAAETVQTGQEVGSAEEEQPEQDSGNSPKA